MSRRRSRYGGPGNQNTVAAHPSQAAPMQVPTAVLQEGERSLWSTYLLADTTALASQSYLTFAVPTGGSGQGWTGALGLPETNMMAASSLPAGFSYAVNGICCALYYSDNAEMTYADLANVQNHMVLRWKFLATFIEIAPVRLIGAGGGIYGSAAHSTTATSTTVSTVALNNGNGQVWLYQDFPVLLEQQAQFNIQYQFGPNAAAVDGGAGNSSLAIQTAFLGIFNARISN